MTLMNFTYLLAGAGLAVAALTLVEAAQLLREERRAERRKRGTGAVKAASLLAVAALAVSVLPAGAQTETEDALPELSCETAPGEAALWGEHRMEMVKVAISASLLNEWKEIKRALRLRGNAERYSGASQELGKRIRIWTEYLGRTPEAKTWGTYKLIPEDDPRWYECVVLARGNLYGETQVHWIGFVAGERR